MLYKPSPNINALVILVALKYPPLVMLVPLAVVMAKYELPKTSNALVPLLILYQIFFTHVPSFTSAVILNDPLKNCPLAGDLIETTGAFLSMLMNVAWVVLELPA